jgi:1-deoxy-D-xylulose-5-phosphate reductoisomerase
MFQSCQSACQRLSNLVGDWSKRLDRMKAISVLGSTGSIGTQTLQIVDDFPDQFRVVALTAGRNLALLVEQIQRHQPELVALADEALLPELKQRLEALDPSDRPAQFP